MVAGRRNLRQMGDTEDLMALPQLGHFLPTTLAVIPLMPVSISSKIIVREALEPSVRHLKAREILDISPPEATEARGFSSAPLLALKKNSMISVPSAE